MALSKVVEEEYLNRLMDRLNGIYNHGRPPEEFIDYFRENRELEDPGYNRFRNFLYALFDEKKDMSGALRGMSKEDFIMRCGLKDNWRLDTILDMGKDARYGNRVAEKELGFWYKAVDKGGSIAYGDRILQRYKRGY